MNELVKQTTDSDINPTEETFELYGFTWIKKDKNKLIPQTPYQFNILYNDETDVLDIDYLRLVIFKDYSREEVHHIWNDDSFIAYRIVDSE